MKESEFELKGFSSKRIPNIRDAGDPLPKLETKLGGSSIDGESTPIPLEFWIDDNRLLNRLKSIGIFDTSDLWIPVIFEQVFGDQNRIKLIHSLLRTIESRISPFKASCYKLEYSFRYETEETILPDLGTTPLSTAYIILQMGITILGIRINIAVKCQPEIMEIDATDIEYKELVDQIKSGVFRLDYETSPKTLEWRDIAKAEKYPLIGQLLEVFDTRTKGYPDVLRLKEIFIRRNGLVSGKIETLEEIAVDKDLTRERIRQIEEKANKLLWYRIAHNLFLSSCRKIVKEQILANLLFDNQILEGEEIAAFLSTYIDFGDYHPAQATALLCSYAKLCVQRSRDGENVWFVTLSERDYDRFRRIFLLVTGVDIDQPQSRKALNWDLFNDARLIFKYHDEEEIRNIGAMAKSMIGSSKVMRFDYFLKGLMNNCKLDERIFENCSRGQLESKYIAGGIYTSICNVAGVSILPCAEYENIVFGRWVSYDLTNTSQNIARSILYAGVNQVNGTLESDHSDILRKGISLSEIVKYLRSHVGTITTEHGVETVCRRFPSVFIYTGSNQWGLIGAGSALSVDDEEHNTSDVRTIDCITDLLLNSQRDMTLSELTSGVREVVPNAQENTIKLYLNTIHKDRFDRTHQGTYKLSERYIKHLENPHKPESTIEILIQVMENAQGPLNVPEIIRRCEQEEFVSHAAISAYLGQNYGGRFTRLENGYYILSSDW